MKTHELVVGFVIGLMKIEIPRAPNSPVCKADGFICLLRCEAVTGDPFFLKASFLCNHAAFFHGGFSISLSH